METQLLQIARQTHMTICQQHVATINKTLLQLLLTNLLFEVIHLQHLITTDRVHHQLLLTNTLYFVLFACSITQLSTILVVSCYQPTSCISSFHFTNKPSFNTILLWYTNIKHVNLRAVVNKMLIKQHFNYLVFVFYNIVEQMLAKPSSNLYW